MIQDRPTVAAARAAHPGVFLLLNLPFGITTGYIIIVVPYVVTHAGYPLLTAAGIVATGLAPKGLKFLWAPLADISLTLKKWYVIAVVIAGCMLAAQGFVPVAPANFKWIAALLCAAEFGASLVAPALGGLMAEAIPDELKGQAAGWYQAGGKVGRAIGGGIGLWLVTHAPDPALPGIVLGAFCVVCAVLLYLLDEPPRLAENPLARIVMIGRELVALLRSPNGLLAAALAASPIGISGIDDFWSGVASEWQVGADTVALVTGFASAVAACLGCLIAGWWADRADRRIVYLGCGALVVAASAALALLPQVPAVFVAGSLTQRMFIGMGDAALSALILTVIGRNAAATKFMVLAALGNIGELYVTVGSAWVHDQWNTETMLLAEAVVETLCIAIAASLLPRLRRSADTMPARTLKQSNARQRI